VGDVTFVTALTLRSADRAALDDAVGTLRSTLEGKGAEFRGPHAAPTETVHVPLYESVASDRTMGTWEYPVFTRKIEIVGHDTLARSLAEREFPDPVHVSVSVDRIDR